VSGFLQRLVARTLGSANIVRPRPELPFFQRYGGEEPASDSHAEEGGFESGSRVFEGATTGVQRSDAARHEVDASALRGARTDADSPAGAARLPQRAASIVDNAQLGNRPERDVPSQPPAPSRSDEVTVHPIDHEVRRISRVARELEASPDRSPDPDAAPVANRLAFGARVAPVVIVPGQAAGTASKRSSATPARLAEPPRRAEPARQAPAGLAEPASPVPARLEIHDVRMSASADTAWPRAGRARRESDRRSSETSREAALSTQPAAAPGAGEPAIVNVTIGRIEVRAPAASAQPLPARRSAPAPPQPSATLDAYLRSRGNPRS
jgi:hypothetical protein